MGMSKGVVCSISKESILDVEAVVAEVPTPIAGCTQQDVELVASQVWVVSSSAPSLPLQIEDASRPEKNDVSYLEYRIWQHFIYCHITVATQSRDLTGIHENYQTS